MNRYYVLEGESVRAVPLHEWAAWFERGDRKVARTEVAPGVVVSTVFLGLNHRFSGNGPPLLFETMVFGGDQDESQWRYSSWDDAQTGHAVVVRKLQKKLGVKS